VLLSAPSTGRCCCWRCGATGQPPRGRSWAAPRRRSARRPCGSYADLQRGLSSAGARRGQVCDTVAELAAGILEGGDWPELLPFMFQCVQSGQPRLAEAALLVFAQLARYLADTLRQYLGTLHGVRAPGPRGPARAAWGRAQPCGACSAGRPWCRLAVLRALRAAPGAPGGVRDSGRASARPVLACSSVAHGARAARLPAQVLVTCLQSPNLDVMLAAMRATSAFIQVRRAPAAAAHRPDAAGRGRARPAAAAAQAPCCVCVAGLRML